MAGGRGTARLGASLAIAAAAFYGLTSPAARGLYQDGANLVFLALLSTFCRAFFLWLWCAFRRQKVFVTGPDIRSGFVGGFFQAATAICVLGALFYVPGPIMVTILMIYPLLLVFWFALRGEEKLNANNLLAALVSLVGLTFAVDVWAKGFSYPWQGLALSVGAALFTVSRMYVYGRLTRDRDPAVVGAESFGMAFLFLVPLMLVFPVQLPGTSVGWVFAFLGSISAVIATFCMFYSLSLIGSIRFSLLSKLEPIFSSLFSFYFLGEILKPGQYVGIIVVIVALAMYQVLEARRVAVENEGIR